MRHVASLTTASAGNLGTSSRVARLTALPTDGLLVCVNDAAPFVADFQGIRYRRL